MNGGRRFAVTHPAVLALFALAPLVFILQTIVTDARSEPFPALILPAFGAAPGSENTATVNDASFVVSFADGGTETFTPDELVGPTSVPPIFIVRHAFGSDGPRARDREVAAWLRRRIAELSRGHPAEQVAVVWTRTTFSLPSGDVISEEETKRIEIPL